jgi:hypothetical protein
MSLLGPAEPWDDAADLEAFLAARIAEEEGHAGQVHWQHCTGFDRDGGMDQEFCDCGRPARTRARLAAMRAILSYETQGCLRGLHIDGWGVWRDMVKVTIAGYADHPDFKPTWKIDRLDETTRTPR